MVMFSDDQCAQERQIGEIARAREQIAKLEQKITVLEMECMMSEMGVGSGCAANSSARAELEIRIATLNVIRVDLATREKLLETYMSDHGA